MRKLAVLLLALMLMPVAADAAGKDSLNPYVNSKLPTGRTTSRDGQAMLDAMGGRQTSLSYEAAHRPNWKAEAYPVLIGNPRSGREVLVLFDFANPSAAKTALRKGAEIARSNGGHLVPLALSSETYGTTLMGIAAWAAMKNQDYGLRTLDSLLSAWQTNKQRQRSHGISRKWNSEYDSAASNESLPLHCVWMESDPTASQYDELDFSKYAYEAGNVNMYQAHVAQQIYGAKHLPAVIVDGSVIRF